jgi:hypothetical protein
MQTKTVGNTVEQQIALSDIRFDETTQVRAYIDVSVVVDYAARMAAGDKFPPLDLFIDGDHYWIGDGWHRAKAKKQNGDVNCLARVHPGGRVEAIKFALGANAAHGLRLTNRDKHKVVEVALREFPKLSSREIAGLCGVGDQLVNQLRDSRSSTEGRLGKDGKVRRLPRGEPKPSTPAPEPPPVGGKLEDIEAEAAKAARVDLSKMTEAEDLWLIAKGRLDNIRKDDPEEVAVLNEVIEYAKGRLPKPKAGTSRAARFANAQSMISDAKGQVEELHCELENRLEGMPENLKGSQKAEAIESAIGELETMISSLEEAEGVEVEFPGMFS